MLGHTYTHRLGWGGQSSSAWVFQQIQPSISARPARCSATEDTARDSRQRTIVNVPEARQPAAAPSIVPVQHSESFLLRQRRPVADDDLSRPKVVEEEEPFAGNAIQWTLRKWDKRMKEEEANPSNSTKTAWKLGAGKAGTAAGKGVSAAAKLSLSAGQEAVKAAVPASQWALSRGMGLAWKLATGAGKNKKKQND